MENLLPCPFCGQQPKSYITRTPYKDQIMVACDHIACPIWNYPVILAKWNVRSGPDVYELLDQLKPLVHAGHQKLQSEFVGDLYPRVCDALLDKYHDTLRQLSFQSKQ